MSRPLIVRAVGDIAINRDDPDRAFSRCAGILAGCDLSIGQLESVFTTAPPAGGRPDAPLRSSPRNAAALRHLGVRALSLCGNHVMSCGPAGLQETAATLAALGIETFGAGGTLTAEQIKDLVALLMARDSPVNKPRQRAARSP